MRFEPYPATDRKRKPNTVRAAVNEPERLRDHPTAPRTSKKPRVVSNDHLTDAERAAYAPLDPYATPQGVYLEPPHAAQVKQSTSFVPQMAPVHEVAPHKERTRGSGPRTPLQRRMCNASTQTESSVGSHWQPRAPRSQASSHPGATEAYPRSSASQSIGNPSVRARGEKKSPRDASRHRVSGGRR